MPNIEKCLRHIRELKENASTNTIMKLFSASKDQVNELIDYLYEEGYIHEPLTMADASRKRLRLTSHGLNQITRLK